MDMCLGTRPTAAPNTAAEPSGVALRVGSVSFLNARPLIYGLDAAPDDVEVSLAVPSALLGGMRAGRFDVALLPVIDYQRMAGLRLLTAGGIGCDGLTLTVRVFSAAPIEAMDVLACDPDSHTSVALARILLAERYGLRPEFVGLEAAGRYRDAARLLIGDKVVCEEPAGLPHQLDLGDAWRCLTGLPFVFAAWMARDGVDLGDLPVRLARAKRRGLEHVGQIIARHATPRGWPADTARRYLTEYLKYDIGPAQLEAIRRFHSLAARHAVLDGPPRPLVVDAGNDQRGE